MQGVTITLVDDVKASTPPIIQLSLSLVDTVATDWSSKIRVRGEVRIAAANFNSQASVWEPLLVGGTSEVKNSFIHTHRVSCATLLHFS